MEHIMNTTDRAGYSITRIEDKWVAYYNGAPIGEAATDIGALKLCIDHSIIALKIAR